MWSCVGGLLFLLWNYCRLKSPGKIILHVFLGLLFSFIWAGWAYWQTVGERMSSDAHTRELCARWGGGLIYEKVDPEPGMVDKHGKLHLHLESNADTSTPYFLRKKQRIVKHLDPQIIRTLYEVVRRSDDKVLGRWQCYECTGGFPGPWKKPGFKCPDPETKQRLVQAVFSKNEKIGDNPYTPPIEKKLSWPRSAPVKTTKEAL